MVRRRQRLPFLAVQSSTVLAGTANGITMVALPWLVLERTGNAAAVGLVAAATALPVLVVSFLCGTIVDRVGRQRTAMVADLLAALAIAALPIVDLTRGLSLWWIAVPAILAAALNPAGVTARAAMVPAAAEAAGIRLDRANAVNEAAWGIAFIVGPGVAGLLIGWTSAVSALWATTAALAVSALLIGAARIPQAGRPAPVAVHERTGFWGDMVEGLRFVRRDHVLLSVGLVGILLAGTYVPIENVLLPVEFENEHAPQRLGVIVMAMSLGWVLGSLSYAAVSHRLPRRTTFIAATAGTCVALLPMAFLPPFPVMVVAGAVSGLLYGPVNPLLSLAMQHRTPDHLRGRVVGVLTSVGYVAGPLGCMVAGPLVQWAGLRTAFMVMTGALLVAGLCSAFLRPLTALDDLGDLHDLDGAPRQPRVSVTA